MNNDKAYGLEVLCRLGFCFCEEDDSVDCCNADYYAQQANNTVNIKTNKNIKKNGKSKKPKYKKYTSNIYDSHVRNVLNKRTLTFTAGNRYNSDNVLSRITNIPRIVYNQQDAQRIKVKGRIGTVEMADRDDIVQLKNKFFSNSRQNTSKDLTDETSVKNNSHFKTSEKIFFIQEEEPPKNNNQEAELFKNEPNQTHSNQKSAKSKEVKNQDYEGKNSRAMPKTRDSDLILCRSINEKLSSAYQEYSNDSKKDAYDADAVYVDEAWDVDPFKLPFNANYENSSDGNYNFTKENRSAGPRKSEFNLLKFAMGPVEKQPGNEFLNIGRENPGNFTPQSELETSYFKLTTSKCGTSELSIIKNSKLVSKRNSATFEQLKNADKKISSETDIATSATSSKKLPKKMGPYKRPTVDLPTANDSAMLQLMLNIEEMNEKVRFLCEEMYSLKMSLFESVKLEIHRAKNEIISEINHEALHKKEIEPLTKEPSDCANKDNELSAKLTTNSEPKPEKKKSGLKYLPKSKSDVCIVLKDEDRRNLIQAKSSEFKRSRGRGRNYKDVKKAYSFTREIKNQLAKIPKLKLNSEDINSD